MRLRPKRNALICVDDFVVDQFLGELQHGCFAHLLLDLEFRAKLGADLADRRRRFEQFPDSPANRVDPVIAAGGVAHHQRFPGADRRMQDLAIAAERRLELDCHYTALEFIGRVSAIQPARGSNLTAQSALPLRGRSVALANVLTCSINSGRVASFLHGNQNCHKSSCSCHRLSRRL